MQTDALSLVGNSRDFVDDTTDAGPRWEHTLLLREPGTAKIAVDALATPAGSRMPGRRYVDAGLIVRLSRRLGTSRAALAQSEQSGYQAMLAQLAGLRTRPLFIIFHGHGWWTRRNRTLARVARRLPWVQFLCLSTALRDIVVQNYGIPASRAHATGYGVDARFFAPAPDARPRYVVSAGAASRDYRTLVEASRAIDAEFRIAADSNWYPEQLNIAPGDVPPHVQVASCGNYERLRELYSQAMFVVVPLLDVRYACGYAVIAEAMAMGKAVVATRTGCPSDLIEDGVSGLYVPPDDTEALRAAIQRLVSDPALAQRMGREGRRLVEERFNLDAYAARLRSFVLPG